jgi:hypothetical protein
LLLPLLLLILLLLLLLLLNTHAGKPRKLLSTQANPVSYDPLRALAGSISVDELK